MRRSDAVDGRLIAGANAVLRHLDPVFRFEPFAVPIRPDPDDRRTRTRLHLVAPYATTEVKLRPDGMTLTRPLAPITYGSTVEQAVAQLYRFTQGMTRSPQAWWDYQFGPVVADWVVLSALAASGYFDDRAATACVLCGHPHASRDWWHDGKVQGPCCTFGRCRDATPSTGDPR